MPCNVLKTCKGLSMSYLQRWTHLAKLAEPRPMNWTGTTKDTRTVSLRTGTETKPTPDSPWRAQETGKAAGRLALVSASAPLGWGRWWHQRGNYGANRQTTILQTPSVGDESSPAIQRQLLRRSPQEVEKYLSWTKIEYQNNLNPIALFSTLNKR